MGFWRTRLRFYLLFHNEYGTGREYGWIDTRGEVKYEGGISTGTVEMARNEYRTNK